MLQSIIIIVVVAVVVLLLIKRLRKGSCGCNSCDCYKNKDEKDSKKQ
jgi:hypothetical protein